MRLDAKIINNYSEIFKALGHPTRLAILIGLTKKQCNVNEIVEKLQVSQSTVSQHLALLRRLKIVEFRKEGLNVCYRISNGIVLKIIDMIIEKEDINIS